MMLYVIDIMSTSIYYSYLGHAGDVNSIRVHVCVGAWIKNPGPTTGCPAEKAA
jgi:hypothetical protein